MGDFSSEKEYPGLYANDTLFTRSKNCFYFKTFSCIVMCLDLRYTFFGKEIILLPNVSSLCTWYLNIYKQYGSTVANTK